MSDVLDKSEREQPVIRRSPGFEDLDMEQACMYITEEISSSREDYETVEKVLSWLERRNVIERADLADGVKCLDENRIEGKDYECDLLRGHEGPHKYITEEGQEVTWSTDRIRQKETEQ